MCGSGTLIVEGAYIALRKAPLIHRGKDDFGFEHHAGFNRALWRQVSDRAPGREAPGSRRAALCLRHPPGLRRSRPRTALRARAADDPVLKGHDLALQLVHRPDEVRHESCSWAAVDLRRRPELLYAARDITATRSDIDRASS